MQSKYKKAPAINMNIKKIKSAYLPTLRGFASHSQGLQQDNLFVDNTWYPTTVLGLTMQVPIFDGLEKKAQMSRAKIGLEKVKLQKGKGKAKKVEKDW